MNPSLTAIDKALYDCRHLLARAIDDCKYGKVHEIKGLERLASIIDGIETDVQTARDMIQTARNA